MNENIFFVKLQTTKTLIFPENMGFLPEPPIKFPSLLRTNKTKNVELKYKAEEDERKYCRNILITFSLIGAALFIFLTVYLSEKNQELYKHIVQVIFAAFGGAGMLKIFEKKN